MPTLRIHIGVPFPNQVEVEHYTDANVLEGKIIFNIERGRLVHAYARAASAAVIPLVNAAYHEIVIAVGDLPGSPAAWNVYINDPNFFDPTEVATEMVPEDVRQAEVMRINPDGEWRRIEAERVERERRAREAAAEAERRRVEDQRIAREARNAAEAERLAREEEARRAEVARRARDNEARFAEVNHLRELEDQKIAQAREEAAEIAHRQAGELERRAGGDLDAVARRTEDDAGVVNGIIRVLEPNKTRANEELARNLGREIAAAEERLEGRDEAERTKLEVLRARVTPPPARAGRRGGDVELVPLLAVDAGPSAAVAIEEIASLAREVKANEKRFNAEDSATTAKILSLEKEIQAIRNYTTAIKADRDSVSARKNLTKLQSEYEQLLNNLRGIEQARISVNNHFVDARASSLRAAELRVRAVTGANEEMLAKVTADMAVINDYVTRLELMDYKLARHDAGEINRRVTELEELIRTDKAALTRAKAGEAGHNQEALVGNIKRYEIALTTYQFIRDHLIPIEGAIPGIVADKVTAENIIDKILAQEAVTKSVSDDTATLLRNVEDARRIGVALKASMKKADTAFRIAEDSKVQAHAATNNSDAEAQLLRAEKAKRIALEEYEKIKNADIDLHAQLPAMKAMATALNAELAHAGNVKAQEQATAALAKVVTTIDAMQNELDRMLPKFEPRVPGVAPRELPVERQGVNIYLKQAMSADRLEREVRTQVDVVKSKSDAKSLKLDIEIVQTDFVSRVADKNLLYFHTRLADVYKERDEVKRLVEEYHRKKAYYPVMANKAADDAKKAKKRARKLLDDDIQRKATDDIAAINRSFALQRDILQRKIDELQAKQRDVLDITQANHLQALIDAEVTRLRSAEAKFQQGVAIYNSKKAETERLAVDAIAVSNTLLEPVTQERANSPSKWVDKYSEVHGIPSEQYTLAVRKIFEYLLNPTEAKPTAIAAIEAADAAHRARVAMGPPDAAVIPHDPADFKGPGLQNADIIKIVESTHIALKQYSLVKQGEDPKGVVGLKKLDIAPNRTKAEKDAVSASEKRLEATTFSKHETAYPDRDAYIGAHPGEPAPPERIVEYVEQKFVTTDIKKVKKEATVRHYPNSNQCNVVSEGALRAQVTDVVNRLGFPPAPGKYDDNRFPIYYDASLSDDEKNKVIEDVTKIFVELGFPRAMVDDHLIFDNLPRIVPAVRPVGARPIR